MHFSPEYPRILQQLLCCTRYEQYSHNSTAAHGFSLPMKRFCQKFAIVMKIIIQKFSLLMKICFCATSIRMTICNSQLTFCAFLWFPWENKSLTDSTEIHRYTNIFLPYFWNFVKRICKKREYISALEQGKTDMQLSTFMLIANALGLRFSLVLGWKTNYSTFVSSSFFWF